jgi:prepilin-type N-terminal cleavage/methylation domain-containing protein/prepilin-type processing-associated H-X9-DG protein
LKKRPQVNSPSIFSAGFRRGFTLLEMLITLAIIGVLMAMVLPNLQRIYEASWNARCLGNLRQIGVAALLCAQDYQNTVPRVEKNPMDPVYGADVGAKSLLDTLSPYGITSATLKCPADVSSSWNRYVKLGTSYEWLNYFDGDKLGNLKLMTDKVDPSTDKSEMVVTPDSQARLVVDWEGVHYSTKDSSDRATEASGRRNAVYADGHVAVSGG